MCTIVKKLHCGEILLVVYCLHKEISVTKFITGSRHRHMASTRHIFLFILYIICIVTVTDSHYYTAFSVFHSL